MKLNESGVTLSTEEHNALRLVIERLKKINELFEDENLSLPKDDNWEPVVTLLETLKDKLQHLSINSRKQKFNRLPLSAIEQMCIVGILHKALNLDIEVQLVLLRLYRRIQDTIKSNT